MQMAAVRQDSKMDVIKVFLAGIIAFTIDYLFWVPEGLKFVILFATAVYVVVRMVREIKRLMLGDNNTDAGDHR